MANYEIKPRATSGAPQQSSKQSNYCAWKCPFCQGKGLNPYGKTGSERCPSCHGSMMWEADIDCSMLATCGRCAATGKINYMGNWGACPNCKGSGKI